MSHPSLAAGAALIASAALSCLGTGCTLSTASSPSDAGAPGNSPDGGLDAAGQDADPAGDSAGGGGDPDGATGDLDAGAASDASASDATWSDNGCTTEADGGQVLFGFDDGVAGWFDDPASSPHGTVGGTVADGVTCPGALTYTVPFTADGQQSLVDFNWGYTAPSAMYGTKLHFSVKVLLPGGGGVPGAYQPLLLIQPMMLWDNWAEGDYGMFEYVNPTLADGQWHEVVIPLTPDGGTFLQAVDGFRFLVQTQASDSDAGPASPGTAEYLFDDVWLE